MLKGRRGVNAVTLESLEGAKLEELSNTLVFSFTIQSPYLLWPGDRKYEMPLMFVRSGDGFIRPAGNGEMDEWLASYYTQRSDEHSDGEREKYAPLGAAKLYERIKNKKITDTDHGW